MDVQLQRRNYQSLFPSTRDLQHRLETSIPPKPKKRTLFQSSADAPPIHPRKLPPIQPDRSAAPQDVPQRAPSPHNLPSPLPEPPHSKPNGFEDLLNPISVDKIRASGRQYHGEGTNSTRTEPMAVMSRLPTPSLPSTSINKHLLPAAHTSLVPPPQSSPRLRQMSQCGPNPEILDAPTSGASSQSQHHMMTFETEQDLVLVPVDLQAGSKVADEKRKRNALASHNFRRRRKKKEQEASNKISQLEAQLECYRRELDFLQGVILENRIPIPPRVPSPRRRGPASFGGPQYQDTGTPARNTGRNTRRGTSAYAPPPPMPLPSEHIQQLQQMTSSQGLFHPNPNPFDAIVPR